MITVCPTTAEVKAPAEVVWALLSELRTFELWSGVKLESTALEGVLYQGQELRALSRLGPFKARLSLKVAEILPSHRRLAFDIKRPLGIRGHGVIMVTSRGADRCQVQYSGDFEFPPGWRGRMVERLMTGNVEQNVENIIARLKAAAELRHAEQRAAASDRKR